MRHFKILLTLLCALTFVPALAQDEASVDPWEKWGPMGGLKSSGYVLRAGYTVGGTTPFPLPAEIRSINEFWPKGGFNIGGEVYRMYSKRWGLSAGLHFFEEGFHTSADVKNYKMSLTMEGNTMSGYFTGTDITNTTMWGFTVPIQAIFRMAPRWNVAFGPYFSIYFSQNFSGKVYDNDEGEGYLRVNDPTGEKVNIDKSNPATYDFSDNMRLWNVGLELTIDWKATRRISVFGMLDWGLTDIWLRGFDAVAFKMYPIYGTVGVAYRY